MIYKASIGACARPLAFGLTFAASCPDHVLGEISQRITAPVTALNVFSLPKY
jgi:hypothetical protein